MRSLTSRNSASLCAWRANRLSRPTRRSVFPRAAARGRPGPRGQKQLKESFGGSSVQAPLEVTSVVRGERDLNSALATIVETVAEALEFKTVVLNLYRPEFDDFCVTDVHGSNEARDALLGSTYEWGAWRHLLTERF